ncbi:hypothetical protein [Sphingomonas adhaesiva]|uniref:hypothetical protein n=1 Tax=Sphingomonas adhaesiva TaxID=28212 RepID=UPI002FF74584
MHDALAHVADAAWTRIERNEAARPHRHAQGPPRRFPDDHARAIGGPRGSRTRRISSPPERRCSRRSCRSRGGSGCWG